MGAVCWGNAAGMAGRGSLQARFARALRGAGDAAGPGWGGVASEGAGERCRRDPRPVRTDPELAPCPERGHNLPG